MLRSMKEVYEVDLHMCEFGMQSEDRDGVGLVYKPTRLLTNSLVMAELMSRICNGKHRRVRLVTVGLRRRRFTRKSFSTYY